MKVFSFESHGLAFDVEAPGLNSMPKGFLKSIRKVGDQIEVALDAMSEREVRRLHFVNLMEEPTLALDRIAIDATRNIAGNICLTINAIQ